MANFTSEKGEAMSSAQKKLYKRFLINKLNELTSQIAEKRETGLKEFEVLEADIYDVCSQSYSKEQIYSLCERDLRLLEMVKTALNKVDGKDFGLCEECQEPINEKRLNAVPWVKYCLECQSRVEEEVAA